MGDKAHIQEGNSPEQKLKILKYYFRKNLLFEDT